MKIRALRPGPQLGARFARHLLTHYSRQEYAGLITAIRTAPLDYANAELLAHHLEKHLDEFSRLGDAGAYLREARHVVRSSRRILAHVHAGRDIQFRFFGARGYAVVNTRMQLCGYFGHSNIEKAFRALREKSLWLVPENPSESG